MTPLGLGHPTQEATHQLQQLREQFRELSQDLSHNLMVIDSDPNSEYGTFEIQQQSTDYAEGGHARYDEYAAPPPPRTAAATDRRAHGHDGRPRHRLRHQKKHFRQNQRMHHDAAPDSAVFKGLKINANLHNTRTRGEQNRNSFGRSVSHSSYQSSGLAEHRGRHSFMGVLRTRKRKVCNPSPSGKETLMCPSKHPVGYDVCITVDQLCDHKRDCPNGEDEHQINCLFYRTTMGHFKRVVDAVVALTNHMVRSDGRINRREL